jgi:hypothetical protein
LLLIGGAVAFGQSWPVRGSVVDAQGKALPGHGITLQKVNGKAYYGISDSRGSFYFSDIPSGEYVLRSITVPSAMLKVNVTSAQTNLILKLPPSQPPPRTRNGK